MSCTVTPQLAARRVDVARHGQVDQKQRAPGALRHHLGQRFALDHVMRRAGRRDHDVGIHKQRGQLLEAHRAAAEATWARPIARS